MGAMIPTAEQTRVVELARTGDDIAVDALAGTGKTSTLGMVAAELDGQGQYVAFNRAIVGDSKAKLAKANVVSHTAHQLAFQAVGKDYAHRLSGSRVTNWQLARHLGCRSLEYRSVFGDRRVLDPGAVARIARQTVAAFCKSSDVELVEEHVELPPIVDRRVPTQVAHLAAEIVPYATVIWSGIVSVDGEMPFTHDHYLKIWQLTNPVIPADDIMFDEAQDADPVMLTVVNNQDAQLVYCGDRFQSIYEWRGAVNAMARVQVDHREWLTTSFRFGDAIADEANVCLGRLGAAKRLSTPGTIDSVVGPIPRPDAVLCRTNGGVMSRVLRALDLNLRPAVVGGVEEVIKFAQACADLQSGQRTSHPDLSPFLSWEEVQAWVIEEPVDAGAVAVFVKLVDDFGATQLVKALGACTEERNADIVISTVHRAKGREWRSVKFGTDFLHLDDMDEAELRLAYVAVTRARERLDLEAWHAVEPASGYRQERLCAERATRSGEEASPTEAPTYRPVAERLPHRVGGSHLGAASMSGSLVSAGG